MTTFPYIGKAADSSTAVNTDSSTEVKDPWSGDSAQKLVADLKEIAVDF